MKIVIASGEAFDLGTTETTPTVGIVDYSRRVTDDYGVTTVVERGFARRMSVRLGVPTGLVDGVQRKLATLRATTAQWVASERYACLSVNGWFKDFDIDLSVPPLSYCTLTVEGLTETEPFVDAGGDPAPSGQVSTLSLLQPVTIDDTTLISSSVDEADYATWSSGTTYALGARVIKMATHRVYESAVAGNVGADPAGATGKWLDIGPTNRWAMFDQALGSATEAAGSIVVTVAAPALGAVALLDVVGTSVRLQATGYDRTQPVGAGAMTFLDLPAGTTQVTMTLTGTGTVSVGTLLAGKLVALGVTEASPTAGITDYSRKDVDDFGAVTLVERAWAKRMTAKALIDTAAIDSVFSRIAAVRATPALWIGQGGFDSLTIYGFFKDFEIEAGDTVSKLSLSVEGLSTAGKVQPFTPGGGSVDWPDVGDPDGTKPANNADVTGENKSKDTDAVGGKPASEFLTELAAAKAQVDAINNQTIPAVNRAVATANDQIAAARSAADVAVAAARKSADDAVAAANAKIATARSDLDRALLDLAAEVSRAKGADEQLTQRIDAISASGGYDDTQVRALIQTVDTARADDKRAIANRVDSLTTDYQNRDTATNARISQDFTTFTNADRALGSRIDSVVTDYRGLDSNTNSRITSSVASLSDADRALGQRIDSLVVQGGGYNDSYVRADITTNNTAAINRDLALGQRIDIVSASFSRGGGNLLSNSDFVSMDGWAIVNTLPGAEPLALNSNGTPYMVGGIENNLSVHQNGRADGGDGAFVRIASDAFGVIPGAFLQFYAFTAAHRSQAWVSIFFYAEDGSLAGDGGQNYGPRTGNGGHDGSGWDQVGVKSIRVPDAARTARLILQKFNTATGQTDSVAWFWHAYVGEARDGQSVWNAYTSGNGKAVQVRSDARISQASTAAASATQAVADLSTSVTTQLLGIGNSLSSYDGRITALSTDQQSTAGAVTSIRASLTRSGGNLISNTDFVTTDGWAVNRFEPNGAMALTPGIDAAGATYHPAGEHVISIVQGARTGGDAYAEWESQPFGVSPTEWIQYYAFYNAHRCDVMVGIIWRNQAGTPVGSANSGRKPALNVDGNNPQNYVQIGAVVAQVPANAVSATIVLRKYDTYLNQTSSYAWFWRAYAGQVSAGQSAWNAYVAGSARAVQARSDAAIVQASTAAATANQSVADLTTSVNARFVGVNTTLTSYDSRISALSTDTQGYAGRTSTLEAQMSRSAPSALQQLTLDVNSNLVKVNDNLNLVNTQVNARIKSSEDVIADLPNRYAAASRTAALEASVNGDGNSRLLARANDQAAVIADAKVGVVTSSLSTLRSDFNGVSATVQQQAGTIASVNGRSQVFWGVTGTTPDGYTVVQLSKADGSPGLFYVGANMLVNGNLTVDGTFTARKFDRSSMSREGSATWTGSITPDIGQTITVPWGLSLPQVPALGRFVYEIQIAVTTNAGQQQISQMNGKPAYLTFVEAGGGLSIVAVDNQGNAYRPVANSWTAVLATTDFVPSWTATIARGSYDTGWVNQGDSYERQIAAIYSVSTIRLKAMWVAI